MKKSESIKKKDTEEQLADTVTPLWLYNERVDFKRAY